MRSAIILLTSVGFLLGLAAPAQSEGQQCTPCDRSREFYEAGDTISAVATALRYALAEDRPAGAANTDASTRQRSYLAYLGAVMASPELRVLLPTSLDSIPNSAPTIRCPPSRRASGTPWPWQCRQPMIRLRPSSGATVPPAPHSCLCAAWASPISGCLLAV